MILSSKVIRITSCDTFQQGHHQNDSCIMKGSDESHFNISLTVRDKVTMSTNHNLFEEKGELKWN